VSTVHEIVLLSDLHMGAGRDGVDAPDPFADDAALAALLDHLADRPERLNVSLRVILLGDIVDFVLVGAGEDPFDRSAGAANRDLTAIAGAHPGVLAALGRLAATAQVEVDVVPGNHDMELALPGVSSRLGSLAAAAAGLPQTGAALRVLPWMVHVPAVLHAEHGQQHHDLNRFADLAILPDARADSLGRLPPAAHLDALLAARQAGTGPRRLAGTLARAAPRLVASAGTLVPGPWTGSPSRCHGVFQPAIPSERHGGAFAPGSLEQRDRCGLPPALVRELDRASAVGPALVARRLGRRALAGAARAAQPSGLDLRPAAARTDAILARHGCSVPFVVFGHTHAPLDEPLGAGTRYLNAGTWSRMGPGAGGRTVVRVVTGGGREPHARLERWDSERRVLVAAA